MLTQDSIRASIHYNASSGKFTKSGAEVGTPDSKGYLQVYVLGRRFQAHRLAWFYMTGEWPTDQIDHINRIKSDNRWCNLREATNSNNMCNTTSYSNSKSKLKGVHWKSERSRWIVQIRVGDNKHYSTHSCLLDAASTAHRVQQSMYGEYCQ